ncbi:MAG: universal stress protein [Euryarchaeota archaeon]|nr:universal stress protein [Euryarchaeota archaeon]
MYKKILIATDGSKHSSRAERHGLKLAKEMGATVTALYVAEIEVTYAPPMSTIPPSVAEEHIEEHKEMGKEIVTKVAEKGKKIGIDVNPLVVVGHPTSEILKHAKTHDIVVMGTLGRSGIVSLLLGSVTEKVVRHADVPVLVVREKNGSD